MSIRSTNRSAFSLPGAWPCTDPTEAGFSEADCEDEKSPLGEDAEQKSITGENSCRNSVNEDSDDFYSFVEEEEETQVEAVNGGSNTTEDLAWSDDTSSCSQRIYAPDFPEHSTPRTSVVSSSSSGSARFGDEEFSQHLDQSEDESALDHTLVHNLNNPHYNSNHSEDSLPILHLAQPDGHNPWTLSLEPTLFGNTSRTSISVESSSAAHIPEPTGSPDLPPTPTANTFAAAHTDPRSRVGVGRPSIDRRPVPLPSNSGFTLSQPAQKKDVVQKTRNLYQKMKRFFTPKSLKPAQSKGISSDMFLSSPTDSNFSPYALSSEWSLNRRNFQKTARSSAPSVALSCTPDIPYNPAVIQDTRRTFEYHRSSTPKVSRSRVRRFSVPTPFKSSSASTSASSTQKNVTGRSARHFARTRSRIEPIEL